ncbi:hypothetical protein [Pseudomonas mohnii]
MSYHRWMKMNSPPVIAITESSHANQSTRILLHDGNQIDLVHGAITRITDSDGQNRTIDTRFLDLNNPLQNSLYLILLLHLRTLSLANCEQLSTAINSFLKQFPDHPHQLEEHHLKQLMKIPTTYMPIFIGALRKIKTNGYSGLSKRVMEFLDEGHKWEEKGNGLYYALVTNDPERGALSWSQISWDITLFVSRRGQAKKKCIVYFKKKSINGRHATTTPLHPEFIDFAKALFSTTMSIKMLSDPQRIVRALQCMEKALIDQSIEPCITNLTNDVLDGLATQVEQDFERSWDMLNTVQKIVNVIENRRLSVEPLSWVNPIPFGNPPRNDRTSQEHDKTIKLPSIQAICELGAIHNESIAINDKVTTCFVALALFAPSRSCELLTLPVNCVTSGESREGPVMGIAWYPAKGGLPLTKYAASEESETLALDAIEYLKKLGETARIAAKWYRENPGKLYLPQPYEHLRNQPLTLREASQIIGREWDITMAVMVKY